LQTTAIGVVIVLLTIATGVVLVVNVTATLPPPLEDIVLGVDSGIEKSMYCNMYGLK
jgi:hypothetical protein